MYIAMNRFRVAKGSEAAFEQVWQSRDTHLDKVPGFVEFHLLKGLEAEDHTLYASHTVWANHGAFEAWTKSEAFRAAHHNPATTSPSISATRNSKALRSGRRWDASQNSAMRGWSNTVVVPAKRAKRAQSRDPYHRR